VNDVKPYEATTMSKIKGTPKRAGFLLIDRFSRGAVRGRDENVGISLPLSQARLITQLRYSGIAEKLGSISDFLGEERREEDNRNDLVLITLSNVTSVVSSKYERYVPSQSLPITLS